MTRITPRRLAAFGAAAAIAVGALAVPALADDATDTDTTTVQPSDAARPDREQLRMQRHEELAAYLAEELDVEVDEVQAALEAFHAERGPMGSGEGYGPRGHGRGMGPGDGTRPGPGLRLRDGSCQNAADTAS
jgi:hypothetical protein